MGNLFWTQFSFVTLCSTLLAISLIWVWEKNRKKRELEDTQRILKGTVVVKLRDELEMEDGSEAGSKSDAKKSLSADIQLISSTKADSSGNGKVGKQAHVDGVFDDNHPPNAENQYTFTIYFEYDKSFGTPGAFYIKNLLPTEFFLVSLTLEDIPKHAKIHFVCNSWICNEKKYQSDRIFFPNNTYLPSETPLPLVNYRQLELKALRGDGTGERKEGERIYDYDVYNDLGMPDEDRLLARPVAGGSKAYPYPRRGRTGRKPTNADPKSEGRSDYVYIPRDEDVVHLKFKELIQRLKAMSQGASPEQATKFYQDEFKSFDDVFNLYNDRGGRFPVPRVIKANKTAWMTDEEFAREVIAGVNPGLIRRVQELPQKSKLHSGEYKERKLDGLRTIDEAIKDKRLFLLDHYETIMPYLRGINSTPTTKSYASRTYFYLRDDGTLKPVFIELSLPNPKGDEFGVDSEVYVPETEGAEGSKWLLAKAYVIVNDTCYHQLISHWLHTHAVVEPFVIATNRQLSVVHPIYKLLHPHFRNTMNINAAARLILVNATGIIESTFLWGKYAVEISSIKYKDWVFPEQALPADLIKRGMAVEDAKSPHGVKLVIEDYPYAVDGLDIWSAIKTWVREYVSIYYASDDIVNQDSELKSWWKEIVEVGHGDKKDEKWWPKMKTREELIEACSIIIWTASALHAAVNFGQYPYGGVILNRPTITRRLLPEKGTKEYDELVDNSEQAYLKTITQKFLAIMDLTVLEILSTHSANEYYLGQRESSKYWTSNTKTLEAFNKFGKALAEIEKKIDQRNRDKTLKNRVGPVNMPYTMLFPSSEQGMTFKGIPNSISI